MIFILVISSINCSNQKMKMINIEFTEEKPDIFGYTGLHLFSTETENVNGNKKVIITKEAKSVDLYKLYNDLAIFLGNTVNPNPNNYDLRMLAVYGNPKHGKDVSIEFNDKGISDFVGFLNFKDVADVAKLLNDNSLDKEEGVKKYFESLDTDVKEELEMLLDDRIVWELHGYFEPMTKFFNECLKDKNEVVIIANP